MTVPGARKGRYEVMRTTLFVLLGYLSGSVLYARVMSGLLKKQGIISRSKDRNPGTANAFMYGGFWCGLGTLLGDLGKGALPVWLYMRGLDAPPTLLDALVLAAPVAGHAFPIFFRFQGGKGIAVTFGCLLGLLPAWQPVVFLAGAFLALSLLVRVSPHFYRSICAYILTLACLFFSGQPAHVTLGFLLMACIVLLRLHMSQEIRECLRVQLF